MRCVKFSFWLPCTLFCLLPSLRSKRIFLWSIFNKILSFAAIFYQKVSFSEKNTVAISILIYYNRNRNIVHYSFGNV